MMYRGGTPTKKRLNEIAHKLRFVVGKKVATDDIVRLMMEIVDYEKGRVEREKESAKRE